MRAWALLVVSSEGQRENLADYLDLARADAERNGWKLERIDDFKAVASGKAGVRAPMVALVAAIAALPVERRPAWVWMRRVDRVGRGRATESMLALYSLHDLGVRIWDHDTGEVRLDTAEGELPTMLKAWFARVDNEIRSGKVRAKNAQKRAAGLPVGNQRPYGLTKGPDGHDVAIPELAPFIATAFQMRCNGDGFRVIGNYLAAAAPPKPFRSRGYERPIVWGPNTVRRMLLNPAYIGTIVDEVTFRRAQAMTGAMPTVSRVRIHPFPLSGAIRCSCGAALVGYSGGGRVRSNGKQTHYRYYCCRRRRAHEGAYVWHRAEPLEEQFDSLLHHLSTDPERVAAYRRASIPASPALLHKSLRKLTADLELIDKRRERVWQMNEAGLVRDEDVQERLDALAAQRVEVAERIEDLGQQIAVAEAATRDVGDVMAVLRHAADTYAAADHDDQRLIAQTISTALGGLYVGADRILNVRSALALAK